MFRKSSSTALAKIKADWAAKKQRKKTLSDPEILGVEMSKWPVDELLALPWHAITHLTDDEKRRIVQRAVDEGVLKKEK